MKRIISIILIILILGAGSGFAYEPEVHDFGGKTINIVSWGAREPSEGSAVYDRLLQAEKDFNVNVEYKVIKNKKIIEQTMSQVMSGDGNINIIQLRTDTTYLPLAAQGALHPLDKILGEKYYEDLPRPWKGKSGLADSFEVQGHTYATYSMSPPYMSTKILIWNKDLFEREGLPSLYDLMESGKWTWSKLREIATQATRDTNGDDEIDQWGIGGHFTGSTVLSNLVTNNVSPTKTVDGKVKFNLDHENVLSILDNMYKLVSVDNAVHFHKWFDTSPFDNGKEAIRFVPVWQTNKFNRESVDYGLAYLPKGSEAKEYVAPINSVAGMAVPITEENPKALIDLLHAIYPPEYVFEKIERFAAAQSDRESYELFKEITKNWELVSQYKYVFRKNFLLTHSIGSIINGEKSPSTGMSEIAPQVQSRLNDLLGQE